MPQWNSTIDLKPAVEIFKTTGDVPKTAERAVEIIEASGWLDRADNPADLRDWLDRLKRATDRYEYTYVFGRIYDAADADRVWIETS